MCPPEGVLPSPDGGAGVLCTSSVMRNRTRPVEAAHSPDDERHRIVASALDVLSRMEIAHAELAEHIRGAEEEEQRVINRTHSQTGRNRVR